MSSRHHNYVRTYRKRSSLGQQDVAFLLGCKNRANVCRYEQGHRLPSLRTALALAIILDVSLATLFSATQHEVQRTIAERITMLRSEIEEKHDPGRMPALASRQLRWLGDHHGHTKSNEHYTR
jgi:transcriptional regulator with XRE-family HTH domain